MDGGIKAKFDSPLVNPFCYLGCIPRLAKIAPSCAIMISSYEVGKTFFARKRAEELQNTLTIQQT
jgi:hypothetical protein